MINSYLQGNIKVTLTNRIETQIYNTHEAWGYHLGAES